MDTKFRKIIYILLLIGTLHLFISLFPVLKTFFEYLFNIISPFIISFILAFLINLIVISINKIIKSRNVSIILSILLLVLIFYVLIRYTIPIVKKEVLNIVNELPKLLETLENKLNQILNNIGFESYDLTIENVIEYINNTIVKIDLIPKILFDKLSLYIEYIVIIPILTMYFVFYFDKIKKGIKTYLVNKSYKRLYCILKEIEVMLMNYIRGYGVIILIVFLLSAIVFNIFRLNYSILFALIIAITNIIPYIGPFVGGAIPIIYLLTTDSSKVIYILICLALIQLIEGNIITPYVQSRKVKINPIIIILGVSILGKIFGITGMIIAVPIISSFKIIYLNYKQNPVAF